MTISVLFKNSKLELKQAISLLSTEYLNQSRKEVWADLGSGDGTFTLALTSLLQPGSIIHAVDRDKVALNKIPFDHKGSKIEKHTADFIKQDLDFEQLDGILMANSLHFVKDKSSFIQKAKKYMGKEGCFLLIEYDMNTPNQWVPYPVGFAALKELFLGSGFSLVEKLHEQPSRFGRANLYSAIVKK
jgi:ubiquinone/menaquinone biosynthesis C-methylase UbiE